MHVAPRITAVVLISLLCGSTPSRAAGRSYAGTSTIAESCPFCGDPAGAPRGLNFGEPPGFASPIILDNHDQFVAELAARVPTSTNGDIRVINGNEVITVRLKPGMRWSDGSPITGALLLETAPSTPPFTSQDWGYGCITQSGPLISATAADTTLTLLWPR